MWQQATTEITLPRDHSIIACSQHIYMGAILRTHPLRSESHIQRNANREVATADNRDHVHLRMRTVGLRLVRYRPHSFKTS